MLKTGARGAARLAGRRGVAALEFALVAPIMLTLVIGLYDVTRGLILWQQVQDTAHGVALAASTLAIQSDGSTSLTPAQAQLVMSEIFAEMPTIRSGISNGTRSVTLSAVYFLPTVPTCMANCTYTPEIIWSVPYQSHGFDTSAVRKCAPPPTWASPGTQPSLTSLPLNAIPTLFPVVVADVHYQFTPMFLKFITGNIDFWGSFYQAERQGDEEQYVAYDVTNAAADPNICPGGPPAPQTGPWQ